MFQFMVAIPKIYEWFQPRCSQQLVLLYNCAGLQFTSLSYISQNFRGLHQALERFPLDCILSLTISTASRISIDSIQVNLNDPGLNCDIYSFSCISLLTLPTLCQQVDSYFHQSQPRAFCMFPICSLQLSDSKTVFVFSLALLFPMKVQILGYNRDFNGKQG